MRAVRVVSGYPTEHMIETYVFGIDGGSGGVGYGTGWMGLSCKQPACLHPDAGVRAFLVMGICEGPRYRVGGTVPSYQTSAQVPVHHTREAMKARDQCVAAILTLQKQ